MTTLTARRCGIAALAALSWLVMMPSVGGEEGNTVTNVDVVRMTASGIPEKEIIRAILEAPATAFDLDREVLQEMRMVGVSEAVIDAMKRAQKKRPASGVPAQAPGQAAAARLELRFEGDPNADAMTRTAVYFAADPNDTAISMIFFVVCVEPTHVPDFWRTKSPLPEGSPRHAMLWSHEASSPYETKRGLKNLPLVSLDVPREVSVDVSDSVGSGDARHILSIGLLARPAKGDTWLLASEEARLKTAPGETSRVTLALSTREAGVLKRPQRDVPPHAIKIVKVEPDPNAPVAAKTPETTP